MGIWALVERAKFIVQLPRMAVLLGRLFSDPRVASLSKIGTVLGALLIVSPLDVFGDVPLIGPLDDVALLVLLAHIFMRICPPEVLAEHRVAVGLDRAVAPPPAMKNVTPR